MAGFLIVTGLTGAIISWDHELDEFLNPHLTKVEVRRSPVLQPWTLVDDIQARHPHVLVSYFPLNPEPGHSIDFWVEPRKDPKTGALFEVPYNQVFIDPHTGRELGTRNWGAVWPLTSETLVSFLYKLHYSLHIPKMWGTDRVGIWLLGFIAILWTIDCFIGLALTFPNSRRVTGKSFWTRWQPSWKIRRNSGTYKLNFDVHRAAGLWVWGLLLTLSFTAISMNLEYELVRPLVDLAGEVTPTVWDKRTFVSDENGHRPQLSFEQVIRLAQNEATHRGLSAPPGYVYYSRNYDVFGVGFFEPGGEHGDGGAGPPELHIEGRAGRILGGSVPWTGTAADIFLQAQFPLHSGRLFGLPGRIVVSLLGAVVSVLSATGVVIWWKKRISRAAAQARAIQNSPRRQVRDLPVLS